jgi:hypothetical protein
MLGKLEGKWVCDRQLVIGVNKKKEKKKNKKKRG